MKLIEYLITILNPDQILEVANILQSHPELFNAKDLSDMVKETKRMETEISKHENNEEIQNLFGDDYEFWLEKMQKEAIKKLLDDNDISYE